MDPAGTQTSLGAIPLLLLCLSYLSIAVVIYCPVDQLSINCGSSINLSMDDGRDWIADGIQFLSER
ncbi:hypothetical protein GLYMA_18G271167v4 [Glycine max]|nr:hypothetical protein GLYMA_18G271167v4 [Glycine max]KAH1156364.1 hypothetical protein GYH30_051254 [Glycine max]